MGAILCVTALDTLVDIQKVGVFNKKNSKLNFTILNLFNSEFKYNFQIRNVAYFWLSF